MTYTLLIGIAVLILWVGGWGIAEMGVDKISGDNQQIRLVSYILLILIAIMILWMANLLVI